MAITMVPDAGSKIQNFQIVTAGSIFDDVKCLIIQGTFLKGKLNGDVCFRTNYSSTDVSIRQGQFSAGLENGDILEYVFDLADWDKFFEDKSSVSATRYKHMFANGVWQSTSETIAKNISGTKVLNANDRMIKFTFVEV